MENNFTDIEIAQLKQTVMKMPRGNPLWIKEFHYYNSNHDKKLGMGCMPCYAKVLRFILGTPELIYRPVLISQIEMPLQVDMAYPEKIVNKKWYQFWK